MSLWLRDECRIVLQPDQVMLMWMRRELTFHGVKHHMQTKQTISCAPVTGEEMPWSNALRSLEAALREFTGRKPHATVILSNQLVHYALIPWSDALSNEKEEMAFARHSFKEMYGSDSDTWELRISHGKAGAPQIACAVDARLLGAVRELFGQIGVNLKSIQPHLMTAYNSCHVALQNRNAWLALVEQGNLCLTLLQDGWCSWIRTMRADDHWHENLPLILEREMFLANTESAASDVFLWAPGHEGEVLASGGRWKIQHLQPPLLPGLGPEHERRFAMYMGG